MPSTLRPKLVVAATLGIALACGAGPDDAGAEHPADPASQAGPSDGAATGPFVLPDGDKAWAWEQLSTYHAPPFWLRVEPAQVPPPDGLTWTGIDVSPSGHMTLVGSTLNSDDQAEAPHALVVIGPDGAVLAKHTPTDPDRVWLSADGSHVVFDEGRGMNALDVAGGTVWEVPGQGYFSLGNERVLWVDDGEATLYALGVDEPVATWPIPGPVDELYLRFDDTRLLVVLDDGEIGTAQVWDLTSTPPKVMATSPLPDRVGDVSLSASHVDLEVFDHGSWRVDWATSELRGAVAPASLSGAALLSGDRVHADAEHILDELDLWVPNHTVVREGGWAALQTEPPADEDLGDDDLWRAALAAPSQPTATRAQPVRARWATGDASGITVVSRDAFVPKPGVEREGDEPTWALRGLDGVPPNQVRVAEVRFPEAGPTTIAALDLAGRQVAERPLTPTGLGKAARGLVERAADDTGLPVSQTGFDPGDALTAVGPAEVVFQHGRGLLRWDIDADEVTLLASDIGDGDWMALGALVPTDGGGFVVGIANHQLHRWSLADGAHRAFPLGDNAGSGTVRPVPGSAESGGPGRVLVSTDSLGAAVFDLATGEPVWSLPTLPEGSMYAAALSPDGRLAALSPEFGPHLLLVDVATGAWVGRGGEMFAGSVISMAFTADSEHLLVDEATVRVKDLKVVAQTRVAADGLPHVGARLADGSWLVTDYPYRLLHVPAGTFGER